jgi:hypothetical protein
MILHNKFCTFGFHCIYSFFSFFSQNRRSSFVLNINQDLSTLNIPKAWNHPEGTRSPVLCYPELFLDLFIQGVFLSFCPSREYSSTHWNLSRVDFLYLPMQGVFLNEYQIVYKRGTSATPRFFPGSIHLQYKVYGLIRSCPSKESVLIYLGEINNPESWQLCT